MSSQVGQDLFALTVLDKRRNGYFLDVGANHPIENNNTYHLERDFNWRGLAIDISSSCAPLWTTHRKSAYIEAEAETIVSKLTGGSFDYASFDVDEANVNTIRAFNLRAAVITAEHDAYRFGPQKRDFLRDFFRARRYQLVCADVMAWNADYKCDVAFEDWWVDPDLVSNTWQQLICSNRHFTEICAQMRDISGLDIYAELETTKPT